MPQDESTKSSNMIRSLANQFSEEEAVNLAKLLSQACLRDSLKYDEIEVPDDWKDDIILLAYEERVLLPMKSLRSSAWEDRILNFSEKELYQMPRVVRFLVPNAQITGQWNPGYAVEEALREAGERDIPETTNFLLRLQDLSPQYRLEAGLMKTVSKELGLDLDMHDTIDRFVRCGIMSACTQRSLRSGLSEYEINRCLYWRSH